MKMRIWLAAVAVSAGLCSGAMAQVTGKVTLDGKPPEMKEIDMSAVKECADQHADPVKEEAVVADDKGDLKNVIVSVKKEEGMDLPGDVPKTPAEITQHGCMYTPHVLACMIGQDILIKNDDSFLHNVHALSSANPPFNFGQPTKDDGKKVDPFKVVETFKVKCDVHPWMLAYVRVFDHPYFATSKDDGTFSIANVPDGDYTFVAWHEKFGEVEEKGTVKGGKAEVNFTFKNADAAAPADQMKEVLVKSAEAKACTECMPAAAKVVEKSAEKADKAVGPQAKAD
jgi:hypothetical protein